MTHHPIAAQLNQLAAELNDTFLERKSLIQGTILALLAKEHVFALGIPGTAKSDFFRAVAHAFINARYFEIQLSKSRPVEAVLGPLNIPAFRESGDYLLKRKGYASQVELCFLDEIGKASETLGHDLLALANERQYTEVVGDEKSVHKAPLYTMFTGSNEELTDESESNAALWDRLLVRVVVDTIQSTDNFKRLLSSDMKRPETKIDWAEFAHVVDEVVPAVEIPDKVLDAVASLREAMQREHLLVSDRRWRTTMKLLKAYAFLNGRSEVTVGDLRALTYALWETPHQIEKVDRLVRSAADPLFEPISKLQDRLKELDAQIDVEKEKDRPLRAAYGNEATKKLRDARDNILTLEMAATAEGREIPEEMERVREDTNRVMRRVLVELMQEDGMPMTEELVQSMIKQLWEHPR